MTIIDGTAVSVPAARERAVRVGALLVVVLSSALAAGFVLGPGPPADGSAAAPQPGVLWPHPLALRPFALTDDAGGRFGREDLLGGWTLLFFGYTHCPDVCPATLSVLRDVRRRLGSAVPAGEAPRVVFVSVDPQRDHAARLARYAGFFGPGVRGVTGSEPQLRDLANMVGAYFDRGADHGGGYVVGHTANVLVIDGRARLVASLPMPHEAGALASRIAELMRLAGSG